LLSSFRHQAAIIEDGVPGLIHLAKSEDEDCSYQAALCFRKLSPNLKSHPVMVYAGVFQALFHLMTSTNINTQKQAASALRDICANPDYKVKCAEEGGIQALIRLSRSDEEQLQVFIHILFISQIALPNII
jgi:hypothetical protein